MRDPDSSRTAHQREPYRCSRTPTPASLPPPHSTIPNVAFFSKSFFSFRFCLVYGVARAREFRLYFFAFHSLGTNLKKKKKTRAEFLSRFRNTGGPLSTRLVSITPAPTRAHFFLYLFNAVPGFLLRYVRPAVSTAKLRALSVLTLFFLSAKSRDRSLASLQDFCRRSSRFQTSSETPQSSSQAGRGGGFRVTPRFSVSFPLVASSAARRLFIIAPSSDARPFASRYDDDDASFSYYVFIFSRSVRVAPHFVF